MKLKTIFTILYFFGGVGLFAQVDTTSKKPVIFDLGIKSDTTEFKGILGENPLSVQVYRQIIKSQYRTVDGKLELVPIDAWIEVKRGLVYTRLKVLPDDFVWIKKL